MINCKLLLSYLVELIRSNTDSYLFYYQNNCPLPLKIIKYTHTVKRNLIL